MAEGLGPLPPVEWAWPRGEPDLLLKAGLDPDPGRAAAALNRWWATHSIDATPGRDHRLLALVAERFAAELKQRPEGPRLAGLRRQRWTRNQLMLGVAQPALERIAGAGLPVLVLAETAELCVDPGPRGGVQLQALDIAVAEDGLDAALAALDAAGWQPWSGESMGCLRRRAPTLAAMQLQLGPLGCLRLHRRLQAAMVPRATASSLHGVPVLLPGTTDRLALALARRSADQPLDGLVQAALLLNGADLDGELLLAILESSQSLARAQILIAYLHQRLHQPVPPALLAALLARGTGHRQRLLAMARLLAPRLRRPLAAGPYSRPPACLGWVQPLTGRSQPSPPTADHQRLGSSAGLSGPTAFLLELWVQPPGFGPWLGFGRELVFELRSDQVHLIQLRAWVLLPGAAGIRLRFRGQVVLPEGDHDLWLSARPSRQLRPDAPDTARRRHGACRFQVFRCIWRPTKAAGHH